MTSRSDRSARSTDGGLEPEIAIARKVRLTGLVQGVGFRWSMAQEAKGQQISGWVRNVPDGSVEALIQGDVAAVEAMLTWMHRGPRGARVESLHATEVAVDPELDGFHQA